MYHHLEEQPTADDPSNFTLSLVNRVFFVPDGKVGGEAGGEDAGSSMSGVLQTQLACLLPVRAWNGHCTRTLYSCKWAPAGLMPVRPQVVLTTDVQLGPGRALVLG